MLPYEVFEATMLICFSISWYWSIARMLRVRAAVGKSPVFVVLICVGYVFGLASKLALAGETGELSWVFWLYAWNLVVTLVDLALVLHFSRGARAAPACARACDPLREWPPPRSLPARGRGFSRNFRRFHAGL